ncbi:MAG: general secretion pathway protein GspB [Candidatus Omnitrophica bacterium]|nr:general secretion pathway protein GspB [Candidatus Omnitrophota bacterium]MBU4149751.1 general secretion pathway protein GspB [Candidatus Omnitrophota bacterium]
MKKMLMVSLVLLIAGLAFFAFAEEEFTYDAKGKRDPFVPLVSKGGVYVSDAYGISGIKDIRLEGIVWDEAKGSIAIINGEIVREGQKIGAAEVLRIEKDAVVFDIDGEEKKLELTSD